MAQAAPGFLGASYTALHPLGPFEDHLYACDDGGLKVLVVDPAYAERGAALLEGSGSVTQLLVLGPSAAGQDLLQLAEAAEPTPLRAYRNSPDNTAAFVYTGRTQAFPRPPN